MKRLLLATNKFTLRHNLSYLTNFDNILRPIYIYMENLLLDISLEVANSSKANSRIFEELADLLSGKSNLASDMPGHIFSEHFFVYLLAGSIFLVLLYFLFLCLKSLLSILFLRGRKRRFSIRHGLFMNAIVLTFVSGIAVYFVGYDYAGTADNVFTLILRSLLSSFEMFLSKSNLIGIADNCKNNQFYMLLFSVTHTLAVVLSTSFAVACFWKRVMYFLKEKLWSCRFIKNDTVYVFWGLNERSYKLAHDINKEKQPRDRFIFVEFPTEAEQPTKGQSFSGLLGLFSYKQSAIMQLRDISYVLFRTSSLPSEKMNSDTDMFDALNIKRLDKILRNAESVYFFVFTDNEKSNLRASVNMLKANIQNLKCVYCATRKTRFTRLVEEDFYGRLVLVDDSRMAVNELKMGKKAHSFPVDYVDIDKKKGVVTSTFKALVVGFGTTGQDALRFLYEFSAFAGPDGAKSPVEIHIIDNGIKGHIADFLQDVPALPQIQEVVLHDMNAFSSDFISFMHDNIHSLNYVVVAAGDDDVNIAVAASIFEYAQQYRRGGFDKFRIFVRLYNENNRQLFDTAIKVYNQFVDCVSYFGGVGDIYKRHIVMDNHLEMLSKEFYKAYSDVDKNRVTWEQRREKEIEKYGLLQGRKSLRRKEGQDKANCMHSYTKERLLGLDDRQTLPTLPDWKTVCGQKDGGELKSWLTCLYNVSVCEHNRWNASHLMKGYVAMSDDVKKCTDGTCNILAKQHRCIVDWKELDVSTQEYDYNVVKTTVVSYMKRHGKNFE